MKHTTFTGITAATLLASAGISVTPHVLTPTSPVTGNTVQAASSIQSNFLSQAAPAAETASAKYGLHASVMLAQAILESGWGQSTLSQAPNYNLFGIKGDYNGASVDISTREEDSSGNSYYIDATFRKYPSYTQSFEDNGALLRFGPGFSSTYYSGTWLENSPSYTTATAALQGTYATSHTYASSLNQLISTYNLTQYDPTTTTVSETKTATQTTAINDSPAATGIAHQVGTLTKGQSVHVSSYLTWPNGTKLAKTTSGWVSATALGEGSSQPPANSDKGAGTIVNTGSPVAHVEYNGSIAVWQTPNGHVTGKYLAHGTNWQVKGKAQVDGAWWYNLGGNQWIPGKYISVTGFSSMPTLKVTSPSTPTPSDGNTSAFVSQTGVVQVHYIPGYGIAVWKSPAKHATGQYLPDGSRWKIFGYEIVNGQKWYKVGTNQWISGQYASAATSSASSSQTPAAATTGVVKVTYPSSIVVWATPGSKPTSTYLHTGTSWRFFKTATYGGQVWYNLGGSQWVPAQYVTVKK